ncbi:MAG: protein translocase subunit SecD [Actinomycetota bacterium]
MKRGRGLWMSLLFIGALVVASAASYAGGVRPVLGLDLEGGVSVILQAPDGTPQAVMDQALENIRRRIDAFGTAEPQLFVSGTNIEVQIPGLARGSVKERPTDQSCIVGEGQQTFGCFDTQTAADTEFKAAAVKPFVQSVCLTGHIWNGTPTCFGSQADADAAIKAITVAPEPTGATGASGATGATGTGPAAASGRFCLSGTGLATDPCFDSQKAAQAGLASIGSKVTAENFCVQGQGDVTLKSDAGAACFPTKDATDTALAAMKVVHETSEFCVISSAGKNLGCFFSQDLAKAQLQATGQERLLQVIGTTARLEQREVLSTLTPSDPSYQSTPVTCGTTEEQQTAACTPDALRDKPVAFLGSDGTTKYQLGPVLVTGDAIKKATAVFGSGSQTSVSQGWEIDFTLTSDGSRTFSDVTTRLVGKQLAIVVDNQVISAPTIQGAITTGSGRITGSFTATRAKDLATQLNAGALPVNLITQQVVTVSPTLGKESLHQGLIAGLFGLIALALYLLFYYRLLGVVAWFGMTIWAILAFTMISIAGRAIGYSLTLAGVAGLVISLGVTADSYIVFFERLKDEVRHGKSPRAAVQPAFKRAYRTIVAADIVTALAAIVLYVTAISSVRGFALTLGVATALDLFVVWFFKRPVVFLIARNERLVNLHRFGLTSGVAGEAVPGEPLPVAGGAR